MAFTALIHPLFTTENIYRAYRRCRKNKRRTVNAMRFEQNMEENFVALHEELTTGTYRPGRSMAFLVEKPKRREIFAADFRDRVVHHILVSHLEPEWERRFIHDSYACRKEKGTHKGVERLRDFTRKVTAPPAHSPTCRPPSSPTWKRHKCPFSPSRSSKTSSTAACR